MNDFLLARWAGMSINELLETDVVWVIRLQEIYYQSHMQGVDLQAGGSNR